MRHARHKRARKPQPRTFERNVCYTALLLLCVYGVHCLYRRAMRTPRMDCRAPHFTNISTFKGVRVLTAPVRLRIGEWLDCSKLSMYGIVARPGEAPPIELVFQPVVPGTISSARVTNCTVMRLDTMESLSTRYGSRIATMSEREVYREIMSVAVLQKIIAEDTRPSTEEYNDAVK